MVQNPSAGTVQATQNTIEWTSWGLGDPRNEIWVSQNCIEVAFPYGEGGGDEGGGGGPAPPPGLNDAMLVLDLGGAQGTLPDYG